MDYPETVTHPSINRARHRVTTLIETNALPLSHGNTVITLVLDMPRMGHKQQTGTASDVLSVHIMCYVTT